MGKHNEFGKEGEQIASDFLLKNGYEVCYRNYRYLKAEVDIIAKKDDILSIVEVKSRTEGFLENLAETITPKKIKLLVMAADHFILENDLDVETRFDVIFIVKKATGFEVEHIKDAFYHF